jgi:hypothetical protein
MATIPNSQKTFSVNEGVNTVYGGSASMKALSQWYTMQDITDTIRPYKVYTALLTQTGGDSLETIASGELEVGVTYRISLIEDETPGDFMNVGAPSNDVGTRFVATGATPNSWGKTTLEYNLGAPIVKVLENTIGNVWFDYSGVGSYRAESPGAFTIDKTTVSTSPKGYVDSPEDLYSWDVSWTTSSNGNIIILSYFNSEPADDVINYGGAAMIEIRVYN